LIVIRVQTIAAAAMLACVAGLGASAAAARHYLRFTAKVTDVGPHARVAMEPPPQRSFCCDGA
jgi:hypothetical protein